MTESLRPKIDEIVAAYRRGGKDEAKQVFMRLTENAKLFEVVALREQAHAELIKLGLVRRP